MLFTQNKYKEVLNISKNIILENYCDYNIFNFDLHFLLFFSWSTNDVIKCPNKGSDTRKSVPITTKHDLFI